MKTEVRTHVMYCYGDCLRGNQRIKNN